MVLYLPLKKPHLISANFNVYLYVGGDAGIGLEAWCPEYGLLHFTGVAQGNGLIAVCLAKRGTCIHLLPCYYTSSFPKLHFSSSSVICRCDSTEKLRNSLDYLRSVLNDATSFKLIYRYAFDFARVSVCRTGDWWTLIIVHFKGLFVLMIACDCIWILFLLGSSQFFSYNRQGLETAERWCYFGLFHLFVCSAEVSLVQIVDFFFFFHSLGMNCKVNEALLSEALRVAIR